MIKYVKLAGIWIGFLSIFWIATWINTTFHLLDTPYAFPFAVSVIVVLITAFVVCGEVSARLFEKD
jgi:hypothetical protein